jgi:hypothetical protein
MASISKQILSGSTNGRLIQVTATASTGTTIHTAVAGTSSIDEVYLWANNTSASAVLLTIEYGGTGTANEVKFTIPAQVGLVDIVTKQLLQNSLVIRAYAATGSVINVGGYVNRIA